jgi:hypothetical protein
MGTFFKVLLSLVVLPILVVFLAIPLGSNYLWDKVNTSEISADAEDVAGDLTKNFRIALPGGYKGGFSMNIGMFGLQAMTIVTLIPADAEAADIFEGGQSINFNPGDHTIVIAMRSNARESSAKTQRDLQRMVMGDEESGDAMEEVLIKAGKLEIAAYESHDKAFGQSNLNYFIFLDDGGLIYISGPEADFDHELKETLAASLADAYPTNELLYSHVEVPKRDPYNPCGFEVLPEPFEVHAVGIRQGSDELVGKAIDPEDADGGIQSVAVGSTDQPIVLILMSGEPTVWQVMSTPDARLAGVIASGKGIQRVIGLADDVQLKEINPHDRNSCKPFYATSDEGSEYDQFSDRVWDVFAQGVTRTHTVHGGDFFRIGALSGEPTPKGGLSLGDVLLDGSKQLLPGKLGLAQLRDQALIRPAELADLEAWLGNHESTADIDAKRLRERVSNNFRMNNAYVITAATDLPNDMFGANASLFIVADGVPDPGGNRGHNTLLLADGRCIGSPCPR